MSKHYDYLIVGAGLYGAVFAHEAAEAGKTEEWQNALKGIDPAKKAAAAADPGKVNKAAEDEDTADERQDS